MRDSYTILKCACCRGSVSICRYDKGLRLVRVVPAVATAGYSRTTQQLTHSKKQKHHINCQFRYVIRNQYLLVLKLEYLLS